MEKKYNLLYIHELVQKHIVQEQLYLNEKLSDYCLLYLLISKQKEPYGVTSQQRKILSTFKQTFSKEIETNEKKKSVDLGSPLIYKDYKEKVNQLSQYLERNRLVLFYPMFLSQFEDIISDYKQVIAKPVVKNFSQRDANLDSKETEKEVQEYLSLMQDCFDKEVVESILLRAAPKEEKVKVVFEDNVSARARRYLDNSPTEGDDGGQDDDDDDGKTKVYSGIQYTDLSRVNINQKYKYEKKCHFKDTVKQYQGLQNKHIPDQVIQDVIDLIKSHGLYIESSSDPFAKLTKDHVRIFLDESDNARYYEDLQLIYSKITGKPCPNISKYERKLYEDFDCLVDVFLSLNINRKNFLNSHYVLRQLLRRQGRRVPEDDLTCLKTLSRVQSHDEIYQKCCEILKWNFNPNY